MKQFLFLLTIIIASMDANAQKVSSEQVENQLKSFQKYIEIPKGYILIDISQVKVNNKDAYCFRYEKNKTKTLGGEHLSFILTKSLPYTILGFTIMDEKYMDKKQLSKKQAEVIATHFLKQIDSSFYKELELQWVDLHIEEIEINAQKKVIEGMKCKYYRPSHKDYAWVIVGHDSSVITFERDILWSNGMQKRITEKWLHDSWLSKK